MSSLQVAERSLVFILFKGTSDHEIAKLLHCSIGNSKSQLYRAKRKMRDLLFPNRLTAGRQNAERMMDESNLKATTNNRRSESARSTPTTSR